MYVPLLFGVSCGAEAEFRAFRKSPKSAADALSGDDGGGAVGLDAICHACWSAEWCAPLRDGLRPAYVSVAARVFPAATSTATATAIASAATATTATDTKGARRAVAADAMARTLNASMTRSQLLVTPRLWRLRLPARVSASCRLDDEAHVFALARDRTRVVVPPIDPKMGARRAVFLRAGWREALCRCERCIRLFEVRCCAAPRTRNRSTFFFFRA